MTSRTALLLPLQNNGELLLPLLNAIMELTPEDDYDVIIVDRGSTDQTVEILASLEGDVTIVRLSDTATLASAIDVGLGKVDSTHTVLLSPHAQLHDGWLLQLTQKLGGQPGAFALLDDGVDSGVLAFRSGTIVSATAFRLTNESAMVRGIAAQFHADGGVLGLPSAEPTAHGSAPNTVLSPHLLGYKLGNAMHEVIEAAHAGASIGELPETAAEMLRERFQAEDEYRLLQQARRGRDVCWLDEDQAEPLVTIRIATYNKADELMEIALPSALAQTYENIEVVVVGDCTDDKTVSAMTSLNDPRVRFYNLPRPSLYPEDPIARWRVAGSPPMNLGNEVAAGAWIAPSDDDDELTVDHVEVLLKAALDRRLEFVWSKTLMETPQGWQVVGTEPMAIGNFTHGSVLYSAGLRFMRMSTAGYKLPEPQDGNYWRRMQQIGVRMGFVDAVTYKYYLSTLFKVAAGASR